MFRKEEKSNHLSRLFRRCQVNHHLRTLRTTFQLRRNVCKCGLLPNADILRCLRRRTQDCISSDASCSDIHHTVCIHCFFGSLPSLPRLYPTFNPRHRRRQRRRPENEQPERNQFGPVFGGDFQCVLHKISLSYIQIQRTAGILPLDAVSQAAQPPQDS